MASHESTLVESNDMAPTLEDLAGLHLHSPEQQKTPTSSQEPTHPTAPTLDISRFPFEIRRLIYRSAIGAHLIHIYHEGEWGLGYRLGKDEQAGAFDQPRVARLFHTLCQSKHSEAEIYDACSTPPKFRNRVDWAIRPRDEVLFNPHDQCEHTMNRHPRQLEFELLSASEECKEEGSKLLYSSNTFSFDSLWTLKLWLAALTPEKRALVHAIRLAIVLRGPVKEWSYEWVDSAWRWRQFFEDDIVGQLPNLHAMHLAIYLSGMASCWRKSSAVDLTETFRPLRALPLRELTVVINEFAEGNKEECRQGVHESGHHEEHVKRSFWERKAIRREWAEEIKGVVLGR